MNVYVQRLLRKIAYLAPGGYSIRPVLHRIRGVTIGKNVWISQYVYIDEIHPECIFIGDNTTVGIGVLIIAHFYWGKRKSDYESKTKIGKDVFLGPHSVIFPNVTIGDGSVIQAGSVVTKDVPPKTLWGMPKSGALAKVSVPLTHEYSYSQFVRGLRPLSFEDNSNDNRESG